MHDYDNSTVKSLEQKAERIGFKTYYPEEYVSFLYSSKSNTYIWIKRKPNIQFYHIHVFITDGFTIDSEYAKTSVDLSTILIQYANRIKYHMFDTVLSDEELVELSTEYFKGL